MWDPRRVARVSGVDERLDINLDDPESVALAVGAGGVVALVVGMLFGSRLLRLLGLLAALTGGGLYAQWKMALRGEQIKEAKDNVRSELDGLDPLARAQVLKDVAQSEFT